MNIFITTKLEKQLTKLKSADISDKFNILKEKLHKISTREELFGLQSIHFKQFKGINNNKIYALNMGSRRIIAMFLNDYFYKDNYCFQKYVDLPQDSLLLFSIEQHDNQEFAAINTDANEKNKIDFTDTQISSYEKAIFNTVNDAQTTFKDFNNQEVLTVTQYNSLHKEINLKLPAILSGIAGSGKTIIAVQAIKEIQRKHQNSKKILYVTFSEGLRSFVKEKIIGENVDVKTFTDLCIALTNAYGGKKLELKNMLITSKQFDDFLNSRNKIKHRKFISKNKDLIYSEICGILKGSMYIGWNRKLKRELDGSIINIADKNSYINRDDNIADDYKAFDKDNRNTLYELVEEYNVWLKNKNMFDINDIAFSLHDIIIKNNIKYDYVIVDEIQDLTEAQIYMLFLLSDKKGILFAGDPNQIINPTFFKTGRLEKIFKDNNIDVSKTRLNENFRNSIDITKLINIVNDIRNKELPARSFEQRTEEITKNNNDGKIGIIKYDDNNKNILFNAIKDKGLDVAVIVSTNQTKELLKKEFPFLNIFTVSEIKGREYLNVITYNILSDYYNIFQNIYKTEWKDKNCEFYFNLFYVAITRTEHNLYIVEQQQDLEILKDIKRRMDKMLINYTYFEKLDSVAQIYLECDDATDERYYQKALDFFNNEEFEKAKEHFKKINVYKTDIAENSKIMAGICEIFINAPVMNYIEKADLLFKFKQFKLAQKYYEKDNNFEKSATMYLMLDDYDNFEKLSSNKNIDLETIYGKYDFAKDKIANYLDLKTDKIKKYYYEIKNNVNNIIKELLK